MDAAGALDRISALPDNLLHLILGLLPDATEAARTAVLSRRWRSVWVDAETLLISDTRPSDDAAGGGYLSGRRHAKPAARFDFFFVDSLFARRGDVGFGSLQIHLHKRGRTSQDKVNQWLRYAMQHVYGYFLLGVAQQSAMTAIVMPSSYGIIGKAKSVQLNLSANSLRLPTAAGSTYRALTELVLRSACFGGRPCHRGGGTLGDFVSSCCPRLRTLAVEHPVALQRLVLRAEALRELRLVGADDLQTVDVAAPNLRVLSVHDCFDGVPSNTKTTVRVVAPRLHEIRFRVRESKHPDLDIHDLSSVRCLREITLDIQAARRSVSVWLLENCPGVQHVDLILNQYSPRYAGKFADLTAGVARAFANVRSLVLDVTFFPKPYLGPSISWLLPRFPRLRSLSVKCNTYQGGFLFCDSENYQKISLGSLEEVEISGFTREQADMDLVSFLFECSVSIKRMTIARAKGIHDTPRMSSEENQLISEKLMDIASTVGIFTEMYMLGQAMLSRTQLRWCRLRTGSRIKTRKSFLYLVYLGSHDAYVHSFFCLE